MTVSELKDLLEQMEDAGYGDREVLFAYQQNYPLQDHIAGGWVPGHDDYEIEDECEDECEDEDDGVVYLVSGGQVYDQPYGPSSAFSEASKTL